MENVYIALGLFSGASTLMTAYSLFWYIRLVKNNPPGEHPPEDFNETDG
jgi:hypothetical protein